MPSAVALRRDFSANEIRRLGGKGQSRGPAGGDENRRSDSEWLAEHAPLVLRGICRRRPHAFRGRHRPFNHRNLGPSGGSLKSPSACAGTEPWPSREGGLIVIMILTYLKSHISYDSEHITSFRIECTVTDHSQFSHKHIAIPKS